ncbi:MAG: DUF4838 domain-containing protein [Phycisphaerae bacterium]|nr:DUF4838 domain-containing protein [Phycisphaerae bacterium]
MEIVRNGAPRAAIVVPDDAFPIVQFAAEELRHHIEKATGAKLEIVSESKKPENCKGLIYIGKCKATEKAGLTKEKLPVNAYGIKLLEPNLFFYGDDSDGDALGSATHIGTISAVYEFLENKLGVRWLWPGPLGEYVPRCTEIVVDEWNKEYRQRFTSYWPVPRLKWDSPGAWSSEENKNRFHTQSRIWLRRQRANRAECIDASEPFHDWWKRFGKTHPEYFALLPNGKRGPLEGDVTGWQVSMCVSNPALWKQLIEDWKHSERYWDTIHGLDYIRVSENDTPGLCTCEKCRAWDAPDPRFKTSSYWGKGIVPQSGGRFGTPDLMPNTNGPSLSDRYAKYYLAVLKEAQKVNPNVIVSGFAYSNWSDPPKQTMLNDHIQIVLVPPCDYPLTAEDFREFREQWDGWRKTGVRMVLRPNFTKPGHNMPVSQTKALYDFITYAAKHGMVGGMYDCMQGEWGTQGPTLYLLGRIHVRPEMPRDEILNEYYIAFGPARDAVKAYFDHWESVTQNLTDDQFERYKKQVTPLGYRDYQCWLPIANRIFTSQVMKKGRTLLKKAQAMPNLSEEEAARLHYLEKGLKHAELTLSATKAANRFKKSGFEKDKEKRDASLKQLRDYRRSIDSLPVSNMGVLHRREGLWQWPGESAAVPPNAAPLPKVWKFRFDPKENGRKKGWPATSYDDSSWDDIRVDSPWEQQKPGLDWAKKHDGRSYDGIAWYRTKFSVLSVPKKNEKILLLFGAVDESCIVYINGSEVLTRKYNRSKNPDGWRVPFQVDVTQYVRQGQNTLAVRVEDRAGAGGIWKPVYLVDTSGS